MPTVAEERPPFISFEMRAVEDREASAKAGHYVSRDVPYVLVTPAGSKDIFEGIAESWIAQKRIDVQQKRFNPDWLRAIEGLYKDWKEGKETPVNGFDIKQWPVASPAQLKMLENINVRTVEDLAAANEETITRLGMGGRALKQKAIDWLTASKDKGQLTEDMNQLRVRLAEAEATIKKQAADIKTLTNKLQDDQK